ncbi:MAG: DegQ family serine endoprotease [Gammaproteobacteria bacterium]|nr:DegQ family serine endoprotease [Gammaproteobacteria bacterium]
MSALFDTSRFNLFGLFFLLVVVSASTQAGNLPDFAALVKANSLAVVNISTTQRKPSNGYPHNFNIPGVPEDFPLEELFERFLGEKGESEEAPRDYNARSLGSGFILSDDGYILTAAHVIESADEVIVRLSDRREFEAEVIGTDKSSDVGLLKIDAENLPKVASIGSTDDLEVGEWVLAIGSPFGFDHSATAGIVSAKGRNLPSENYVPFIQTDVAINPGNSGGPLFDLDGEVVGINSQIYSRTGGFMGLSFAIPIEMAMNVADQLRTQGRVSRGWLGVYIQDVTRELADSFGMPHPTGALVAKVLPDSPAQAAGLQIGDIVLKYNGNEITNSSKLPPLVGISRINRPAELLILRSGKQKKVKVDIGELPDKVTGSPQKTNGIILGMSITDITPQAMRQLDLDSDEGVLVESMRGGPAQAAGIREGDIIQMINNERIRNVDEFEQQLSKLRGRSTPILVLRESGPIFLALRVPGD